MEDKIKCFVDTEPGFGSGFGSGSGSGSGYDDGSGSGFGFGYGCGDGLILNGYKIYDIDGVPTLLYRVFGDFAKGAVVYTDLTLTDCYIAKAGGQFAHGKTIHEAYGALTQKLIMDSPIEDRIDKFVRAFVSGSKYNNRLYYQWHHVLTGSCKFGRDSFVHDHKIDLDGKMTPEEFILLTEGAYGGDIIRKLKPFYNMKED